MNPLTTLRQEPKPQMRRVFALFILVWLTVALQPCAMAFGDFSDRCCPDCPSTSPHDSMMSAAHEMGDSIRGMSMCASATDDCTVDAVALSSQSSTVRIEDTPRDTPTGIVPSDSATLNAYRADTRTNIRRYSYQAGKSPALNLLYCIFQI